MHETSMSSNSPVVKLRILSNRQGPPPNGGVGPDRVPTFSDVTNVKNNAFGLSNVILGGLVQLFPNPQKMIEIKTWTRYISA